MPQTIFLPQKGLIEHYEKDVHVCEGEERVRQFGLNSTSAFRNHRALRASVNVIGHSGSIYLKIVIALRLKLQGSVLELSAGFFGGLVIFPSLQSKPGGEAGFGKAVPDARGRECLGGQSQAWHHEDPSLIF